MNALDKQIIGDWVDLREASRNFFSLIEFFKPGKSGLKKIILELENSIENGILEYKNIMLRPFFRLLEETKYKNVQISDIKNLGVQIKELLFVNQVQRLFTTGVISISQNKSFEHHLSAENIEINSILKDVLGRIKINPGLKSHVAIKNILVQISVYKREKALLEELTAKKGNKNQNFIDNFRKTFESIFKSIRKNYESLLKEEAAQFVHKNPLSLINIEKISHILFNQAKEFSAIISTLEFVLQEKYKIRAILLNLTKTQDTLKRLIQNEMKIYEQEATLAGLSNTDISREFCHEIISYLNKYSVKEYSQTEEE
ncbi:MAG: hypothetical protein JXR70_09435 [Spirochaetales bacterium]|nr:hypothetical protein [Spirochaetales bacterium]